MELQIDQKSEEELVEASRSGDRDAYAALVRRHARRIYAICLGILGSKSDSEDVFQETFVKGLTRLDTLRDSSQFPAWISQIARNLCRDHYRKAIRRRELLEASDVGRDPVPERFDDLHEALERLPEKHRLPLMLFYFDGKSSETLARELNMSRAGASTRLFRARNELRKLLGEREENE
jgi:RNA polymerase sigma-70 factor (ECF subfamily)